MQSIAVIIPVYRGESTLATTVGELLNLPEIVATAGAHEFTIAEIVLVHDAGPDDSDEVISRLEAEHPRVRAVWLSRNYGQHAATLAGIARTTADWVLTVDEDGQHDPNDLPVLCEAAITSGADVVYASPIVPPGHGAARNSASRLSKWLVSRISGNPAAMSFNSYRLIRGSIARAVADIARPGVYLDVALGWMTTHYATAQTSPRGEVRRSGYSVRQLVDHFGRLVISSGTRVLRLVSLLGVIVAVIGTVLAVVVIIVKLVYGFNVAGWASTAVILLVGFGATLFVLGVIAEYIGGVLDIAMGRPAYLVLESRARRPKPTSTPPA